jgi:hypothetical protein
VGWDFEGEEGFKFFEWWVGILNIEIWRFGEWAGSLREQRFC